MLFLIALEMVFEKRTQRREDRAEAVARDAQARQREWEDISVFPMGIPMLAGPGSIASAMLLLSRGHCLAAAHPARGARAGAAQLAGGAPLPAPPLTPARAPTVGADHAGLWGGPQRACDANCGRGAPGCIGREA